MALDFSAATPILKETYLPAVQELLNNATPLLAQIEKEVNPTEGENFQVAIHVTRNQTAGLGLAEGATLPAAGNQGHVRATVTPKLIYSRIQVSGKAIAASKSNKGSFVRALENEMKLVIPDTKREINRQVNGDGTGALAYWTGADDTSGTNVDDGFGNGSTYLTTGAFAANLIDASDDDTVLDNGSLVVTRGAVGAATTAITWTGTITGSANNDYLVRKGSLGNEMTGIQAIIHDGNPILQSGGLHGIPVASYPDWKAVVMGSDSAKQDLSFTLIQQLLSRIQTESATDEGDIKMFLAHPSMRDTYVKLCQDERAFYNTMKLDGGWEAVTYNGKPLVADVQTRRNALYAITPSSMCLAQLAPISWFDKDGSVFYRISGGDVDAYGATLYVYQELLCKVRNANGVIKGLNDVWV
jgi:hypothetical protein